MADDLGAVRRTLRSTGDRQTPETGPQESAGTTNSPTLVSTDAGNGTDDLSPEVSAIAEALANLRGRMMATAAIGGPDVTDDALEAFAALSDCTACGGTGKDDHGSPFEAPLAVHFAGPPCDVGQRKRQLCMWCGHVLIDVPAEAPLAPHLPWPAGSVVQIEDGYASQLPYPEGDALPPGCCALPDDEQPTPGPGCYPPADGWDGVAVRAAADRSPAAVEADNALRLHLASVHKLANAFELPAADLDDVHQHDHFGPCGLRNHDIADRSYDEAEARAVVAEAEDGPDEAQETRAAADWPADPKDDDRG